MNLIKETLSRGKLSLSEYYSKRFFSHFGIPVSREAIALDADSVEKSIKEHIKIASALYSRDIIPAKKCLSSRRLMRNLRQSRSVQKTPSDLRAGNK